MVRHTSGGILEGLRNPERAFGSPEAVERAPELNAAEKLVILARWEKEARAFAFDDEGETGLLERIAATRARLEAGADEQPRDQSVLRVRHFTRPARELAHPDHGLGEALVRLRDQERSILPVCDGDEIVGVVTYRDLEEAQSAAARSPRRVTVRHVMSTDLAFCYPDDEARTARAMMHRHGCHHLLVVDGEKRLVGILERGDLPRATPAEDAELARRDDLAAPREAATEGIASTVPPGGLEVYAQTPRIRSPAPQD